MFEELISSLLKTEGDRRSFRRVILVLLWFLVTCLVVLLAIGTHRAYNNAEINLWGFVIGPAPGGGGGKTADAPNLDLSNVWFEWRTPSRSWDTDAECEEDLKSTISSMQLSGLKKSEKLFWGEKDGAMVLLSCFGESADHGSMASVVVFGKEKGATSAVRSFMAMMGGAN
ncbi:hypothetical protein [Rhizobium leguminosarum]|uniref:hypothetical protein n=1 Tax=Rhizobium leguminosarum TaxID=384 RepID=UPI0014414E73|nr:hypothetical protein [Rhizobium leguminosarum]NKL66283.1 hypothetical protein [Rhizobium leguminosarum bv. viciae]